MNEPIKGGTSSMVMKETKWSPKESVSYIVSPEADQYFIDELFGFYLQGKDDEWMLKRVRYISRDGRFGRVLSKEILDQYKNKLFTAGQLDIDHYYMDKILYFYGRDPKDGAVLGNISHLSPKAYEKYKARLVSEGRLDERKGRVRHSDIDKHFMNQVLDSYLIDDDDEWTCRYLGLSHSGYTQCQETLSNERKLGLMNLKTYKDFVGLNLLAFNKIENQMEQFMRCQEEGKGDQFIQEHLELSPEMLEQFKQLLQEEL